MQTFLPFANFNMSARCLDRLRLGKQRIECRQILNTLQHGSGWSNHPAIKMWMGCENALVLYGLFICDEWIRRGYVDSQRSIIFSFKKNKPIIIPDWLGCKKFHASHRSNLLRKFPEHYTKFGWKENSFESYFWPV